MDLIQMINEAKEQPSENCAEGKEHEFKHKFHADGREEYSNYHVCEHCNEVVVKSYKRTGTNKLLWS